MHIYQSTSSSFSEATMQLMNLTAHQVVHDWNGKHQVDTYSFNLETKIKMTWFTMTAFLYPVPLFEIGLQALCSCAIECLNRLVSSKHRSLPCNMILYILTALRWPSKSLY